MAQGVKALLTEDDKATLRRLMPLAGYTVPQRLASSEPIVKLTRKEINRINKALSETGCATIVKHYSPNGRVPGRTYRGARIKAVV